MKENIYIFPIKDHKQSENELNYGIQILRAILSYLILQLHCYNINLTNNKVLIFLIKAFHFYVPTFYIISFYFSYRILKSKDINKIKLRLRRIGIPYFIWPTLFFLFTNIYYSIHRENKYNVKDLFIQILTGKRIYNIFWYLCTLLLSFVLFSLLCLIFEKNFLIIIQLIGLMGSLYYPYHFYNNLFNKYIIEISSLIQDFSKVLFYGAIGITFGSLNILTIVKNYRKRVIFFCLYILYFLRDFLIIIKLFYLRCIIFGIGASVIFILFSILPLENIKNKTITFLIKNITNYSGGIFYLHMKIRHLLNNKILVIKNRTLLGCFLIYIICYFISFFGTKFFVNSNLKYLFC